MGFYTVCFVGHAYASPEFAPEYLARPMARERKRGLLGGLAGGTVGGVVAFTLINGFSSTNLASGADAVSIANTYIVYSTLMIAAVAVFLTMAGLIFTQHFAMEKERHVADAFAALVSEMARTNGCAVAVVKEVMKNAERKMAMVQGVGSPWLTK
jgi:hypothetical protein